MIKFKNVFADEIFCPIYQQVEELITNLLVGRSARDVRIFYVFVTVICVGVTPRPRVPAGPTTPLLPLRQSSVPRAPGVDQPFPILRSSVVRMPGFHPDDPGSNPGGAPDSEETFISR